MLSALYINFHLTTVGNILLSNKTMNFLFDKLTYNFISKSNFFGIAKTCTGFTNCDVQL